MYNTILFLWFGLCNKIIKENHGKIDINQYGSNFQNLIDAMLNKN